MSTFFHIICRVNSRPVHSRQDKHCLDLVCASHIPCFCHCLEWSWYFRIIHQISANKFLLMKKVGTNSLIWECDILLLIVINPLFNLLCIVTETPIISLQTVGLLIVKPYLINYRPVTANWPQRWQRDEVNTLINLSCCDFRLRLTLIISDTDSVVRSLS